MRLSDEERAKLVSMLATGHIAPNLPPNVGFAIVVFNSKAELTPENVALAARGCGEADKQVVARLVGELVWTLQCHHAGTDDPRWAPASGTLH